MLRSTGVSAVVLATSLAIGTLATPWVESMWQDARQRAQKVDFKEMRSEVIMDWKELMSSSGSPQGWRPGI